jgi:hypothetical protein
MNEHECAILFWPAVNKEKNIEDFNRITGYLSNIKEKRSFEDFKISWVNSTCHDDMLDRIEYDKTKTPVLVYFWPHRAAYAAFDYPWQEFNIEEFLRKGKEQRINPKRINREQISISNRNCEDPNAVIEDEIINAGEENINSKKENTENKENEIKKNQKTETEEINLDDTGKKNDL